MTTNQMIANQIKRDEQLTNFLCVDAQHVRTDLEAWIREELTQSIQTCSIRLEVEVDGPLKDAIGNTLHRLRRIDDYEFTEASNKSKQADEDVASDEADNAFHGYELLMQAHSDLVRIGRELLDIRYQLAEIVN